jgi:Fe(3+) dicitrate transport protein
MCLQIILRLRIITITMLSVLAILHGLSTSNPVLAQPGAPAEQEGQATQIGPAGPPPSPEEKPLKVPLTEIIGTAPTALDHIPGSGRVVTKEDLFKNHRFTINEALREVPGVNVRDEDGLGIRPNIGIRGLDPTRSRKIHIMEDGVPIMLMPYADPSSYYFPPIFRFDRIEILKGSGQLLYGPQTIGGVMNMITRMPPLTPQGNLQVYGGNLNYINTHLDYGGTWGKAGYLVDATHYQSDTPRFENIRAQVSDITLKTVQELSERATLLVKANIFDEKSGIGYQGLTEGQYADNPRYTSFTNDNMDFRRYGLHVAHQYMINANLNVTTNVFGHYISRDWTRAETDPSSFLLPGTTCQGAPSGGAAGFNTGNATCATQTVTLAGGAPGTNPAFAGRFTNAREYTVYGVEPRFHSNYRLLGVNSEADFGARFMYEESDRKQFRSIGNPLGQSCTSTGTGSQCIGENNLRHTYAYAAFVQNRFLFDNIFGSGDQFTITPGVRLESVNYDQQDRTANNGGGNFQKTWIIEPLPGIGATYSPIKQFTVFAGVHRGFAPPQISDAIQSNRVVDLDAELSWNYELGLRTSPTNWAWGELTLFQMNFQNQIITQSAAGGTGATLTNAGRTLHRGLEAATKLDLLDMVKGYDPNHDVFFQLNYTWVAQAEFTSTRNSSLSAISLIPGVDPAVVSVTGNRLPFSPKNLFEGAIGYANRPLGFDARMETQCVSDQFSDDRNTYIPTPNGQRGVLKGWCIINTAINQYVKPINTTFFFIGKNIFDQTFIVDRSRGIYAGLPALWQGGAKWTF